jgi:VWFA-related protein
MTYSALRLRWLACLAVLFSAFASTAAADVDLRIVARPISDPMRLFVRVTDAGVPVDGLTINDFNVALDGVVLNSADYTFALPPDQDPTQRISVIFAMDFSGSVQTTALTAMREAVIDFIENMEVGEYAAIIKFNNTQGEQLVQPFTEIDLGGNGAAALVAAVEADYNGTGTPLLDAVNLAVDTFASPGVTLPAGPKAIIVITDGGENSSALSQSDVVANAQAAGLSVFTIGVGDIETDPARSELLESLAEDTGGDYFPAPDDQGIADAYLTISESLNHEYLLTVPADAVTNCAQHEFEVTSQGDSATVSFNRCDTTPDDFNFTNANNVQINTVVTSNEVTIVGIDTPAAISVTGGEYSIGCGNTFTSAPGTIAFNETVCVRHTSAASYDTTSETVLIIGGVSENFMSTTREEPQNNGGGGGGGGGSTGLLELMLALGLAFAARRRPA